MNLRISLYELAARHRLSPGQTTALRELAGFYAEPAGVRRWLLLACSVLAAALFGLGIIFWLAANWDELARMAFLAGGVLGGSSGGGELGIAAGAALGLLAYLAGGRSLAWSASAGDRPRSRAALICIALAPLDPRSLMQGDYMALNYAMLPSLQAALRKQERVGRLLVVARVDELQVATLTRLADATPLATGEMPISLSRQGRRWVVASDAWFFREGDGARWSAARYGEFRVLPDGQPLLVGLADEKLARIVK